MNLNLVLFEASSADIYNIETFLMGVRIAAVYKTCGIISDAVYRIQLYEMGEF